MKTALLKNKDLPGKIVAFFLFLIQVLMLIYPALVNGYPLLYSDSASYIVSGHDSSVPIDRPITYGLFVRHISMSYSLWFVVVAQAAIVAAMTGQLFRLFFEPGKSQVFAAIAVLLLCALTSLPNYTSQIMPDVFSGILILSIALFLFAKSIRARICYAMLIVFSAILHFSNLLTLSIVAAVIIPGMVLFTNWKSYRRSLAGLVILVVFSWGLLPTINWFFSKEFYISKSGNVFLMGRMIETGLAKDYLDENCTNDSYSLCAYKDSLPQYAWQFLWNDNSPLYANGCSSNGGWSNCWIEKNEEYGMIIKGIMSSPKLLGKFIKISARDFKKQVTDFEIGHLTKQGNNFDPIIKRYFDDYPMFVKCKQFGTDLFYKTESRIQNFAVVVMAALVLLLGFALIWKKQRVELVLVFFSVFAVGMLANALDCSMFSGVLNRYQGRVIWLLILLSIVLIFLLISQKNKLKWSK